MARKKVTAGRSVFRIEITPTARDRIQEISDEIGMTEIALCSKVIEFVADLPNEIRLPLLGVFPDLHDGNPAIKILERMAAGMPAVTSAVSPDPSTHVPARRSRSSP